MKKRLRLRSVAGAPLILPRSGAKMQIESYIVHLRVLYRLLLTDRNCDTQLRFLPNNKIDDRGKLCYNAKRAMVKA